MTNKRNFYRLLHVQFDAPEAVIKASYRSMMQKLRMHPDLGGDEAGAKLLNEALETLLDPVKRARYDRSFAERQGKKSSPGTNASGQSLSPDTSAQPSENPLKCLICGTPYLPVAASYSVWQGVDRCQRCSSPLREPQVFTSDNAVDLRRLERVVCSVATTLRVGWPNPVGIEVELLDFSLTGAGLRAVDYLVVGQVVLLKSVVFEAVAIVTHCHEAPIGGWLAGLRFQTLHLQTPPGQLLEIRC